MRIAIPLAAALALAGCGEIPDQAPLDDETPIASETSMPVEPDGGIGDGATPLDELAGIIPERFQGVWDYVKGSCAPESDLRMEIKGREILYYESIGQVSGVGSEGNDALVDLVMEGEGEKWVQITRLSLSEDGETLSVTDGAKPKAADEYPRKRCKS